jgi:hypothetical protein
MFEKGISWLNVQNVRKKSVNQKRLGRWLVEKIRMAKERNSQSDCLSAVGKLSDPF